MSTEEIPNDLKSRLEEPFPEQDVEWRVLNAKPDNYAEHGVDCVVAAYITARAIMNRLDEVVGPGRWCNTPAQLHEIRHGLYAMQVGIGIKIDNEWVFKYDLSEPTSIEPAKGAFSGAMKRAGAQWGIGRYLYRLDNAVPSISKERGPGWRQHRSSKVSFYWKPPELPAWALPRIEAESRVSQKELNDLYFKWVEKFAPTEKSGKHKQAGFAQFVDEKYKGIPVFDRLCWTRTMLEHCKKIIEATKDPKGPPPTVPF